MCLMMVGQLILDVCSLALNAFFTFNREDVRGDKGTGILGTLEQEDWEGRIRTSNYASLVLQEKLRTRGRGPFVKPVWAGGKEVPHPVRAEKALPGQGKHQKQSPTPPAQSCFSSGASQLPVELPSSAGSRAHRLLTVAYVYKGILTAKVV